MYNGLLMAIGKRRNHFWRNVILAAVFLAIVISAFFWGPPLWALLSDRPRIENFLRSLGPWGPVGLIIIQALQVFLFPIPGFFGMLGGFLFGFAPGLLYSQIGTVFGSMIAFFLAKTFGRPLVKRFVNRDKLDQLDTLARDKGKLFFLIYYLVPYVPKDAMCYVAGLTPLSYLAYLMISFWGRLPGTISATLVGAGIWQFQIPAWGWILIGCLIALLLILALVYRRYLKSWVLGLLKSDRTNKRQNQS